MCALIRKGWLYTKHCTWLVSYWTFFPQASGRICTDINGRICTDIVSWTLSPVNVGRKNLICTEIHRNVTFCVQCSPRTCLLLGRAKKPVNSSLLILRSELYILASVKPRRKYLKTTQVNLVWSFCKATYNLS